jgi:hypothetical protein
MNYNTRKCEALAMVFALHNFGHSLLHIVPFCKGKNKKLEGFAKQKQPTIFAM